MIALGFFWEHVYRLNPQIPFYGGREKNWCEMVSRGFVCVVRGDKVFENREKRRKMLGESFGV